MLSSPLRCMKMCSGLYIHMVGFFFNSHKSDAGVGLVDLPHVQLLVFLQGLLELGGGEATRNAALLCFSHADHSASSTAACRTLCGELTHQREDDVGRPLSPKHKVLRLDLPDWKNTRLLLASTLPRLFVHFWSGWSQSYLINFIFKSVIESHCLICLGILSIYFLTLNTGTGSASIQLLQEPYGKVWICH